MFQDLWYVVQMFFFSIKPLMWTVLFILIIIFLFAMFSIVLIGRSRSIPEDLTLACDTNTGGGPESQVCVTAQTIVKNFGNTSMSVLTLFQIMTLDEWKQVMGTKQERVKFHSTQKKKKITHSSVLVQVENVLFL